MPIKTDIQQQIAAFLDREVTHACSCPLCRGVVMNPGELMRFSVKDLSDRWQDEYGFVPIPFAHRELNLTKVQCRDCGLYLYDVALPGDYPQFYETLGEPPNSCDPSKRWDYALFAHSIEKFNAGRIEQGLPPANVLEIGCAVGNFLAILKEKGIMATGLDTDTKAADHCIKRGLCVINSDLEHLPVTGRHDVIVALQVLEHITDIRKILSDVRDMLPDGGRFYVSVPNPDQVRITGDSVLNFPPHHQIDFSKRTFEWIAEEYGFSIKWIENEPLNARVYRKYKKNVEGIEIPEDMEIDPDDFDRISQSNLGHTHAVCFVKQPVIRL